MIQTFVFEALISIEISVLKFKQFNFSHRISFPFYASRLLFKHSYKINLFKSCYIAEVLIPFEVLVINETCHLIN